VTIAYHLDGVAALALSPTTIARIFAGGIKVWNDPAIAKDNPGVALPAIVATRASSGQPASVALASFVGRAAPGVWHVKHGASWPEGVPYNDFEPGRGDAVRTKNGAVTYLELPAAVVLELPLVRVRNRAGVFVAPTAASTTAAGARVVLDKELFFDPIDAPGTSVCHPRCCRDGPRLGLRDEVARSARSHAAPTAVRGVPRDRARPVRQDHRLCARARAHVEPARSTTTVVDTAASASA
jgi:hypothetical protein